MPIRNNEHNVPRHQIVTQERAQAIARAASSLCGIEVEFRGFEGDSTVHYHVDLQANQVQEVPVVVGEGEVQISLPPGDLSQLHREADHLQQNLAA